MNSLLKKLGILLSDKYKLLKYVHEDIRFLMEEVEAMGAFLQRMSDIEELDEQGKLRVRVVRELSYDIEDNIDKFMVLVDRDSSSIMTHGFMKLIDKSKSWINDIRVRYRIVKEVKTIKIQVMEASERYARYKIDGSPSMPRNTGIDPRVLTVFKDASELVGIEGPRDELVKWLKEDRGESAHLQKVVSIVGSGGAGKTTLANQVYQKVGAVFNCRAFVSVSRKPDLANVFCSLLSQICNREDFTRTGDQLVVINKIWEFLKDKRYFIVLDDIWDVETWGILECALVKNSYGSRIMTTTRIIDVAKSCCSSHEDLVYQIRPLSVSDSKKLFFKRIFGCEESCPSNLREGSQEILRKCGGLPLAITAVSSLLATRVTKDQWDRVRKSINFAFEKNSEVEGMRRILSLSYFDLPHHIRSCLLYLTLFPEDYVIRRERLVHRWIAEGFIHSQDQDHVELGDTYFHELVNRSLIQPVDIGYDGKAWGCRVHDTILDFLSQKSTEENFCTLLRNHSVLPNLLDGKVRRLSLMANDSEGDANIPSKLNASHIRSLSVFGHGMQVPSLSSDFSALRVLDLNGCPGLENHCLMNIGRLSQLRYLNISRTRISELPREIGDLQHLETLDAVAAFLNWLPESAARLQRLARLFLSLDTKLPDGIGNMKNLQELGCIHAFKHSLNFLDELGRLTNLRKLSITWDTNGIENDVARHKEKLVSTLYKLDSCNLSSLSIDFNLRESNELIGDTFCPALNSIREISLLSGGIHRISKLLVSLNNLECLLVEVMEIEHQDVLAIGSIPSLLEFRILLSASCNLRIINIRGGFQKLKTFSFHSDCARLVVYAGAMPVLRDLQLHIHPTDFKLGGYDFGMQHLFCISRVGLELNCDGVKAADVEAAEAAFNRMVEKHTNRPTLEITRARTWSMLHDENEQRICNTNTLSHFRHLFSVC